jgi:proto-oncogene tyrosine-protein kinase ROS
LRWIRITGELLIKPSRIDVQIKINIYISSYLFWVITGTTSDTGLFRIDLGDISNGISHESKPLQLIKGDNLGSFTIDHTRFRLLVPLQAENTIIAVSLDG